MACSRKSFNTRASSLLESVIALSIISVCLYIAVLIYSSVFSNKTSSRYYVTKNRIKEAFYLMQAESDSLNGKFNNNWQIEEEYMGNTKKISLKYTDSIQSYPLESFYVANE